MKRATISHRSAKQPIIKRSHQWIDARNLAMARLIASKIRRKPALFEEALVTLRHWKSITPVPKAIREWDRIFRGNSREAILETFTQENEEGNRLRQSAPFCGILTLRERRQFFDQYEKG